MAGNPASSASEAVAKAVQKNFIDLRNSVVHANILDKLFQREVIDSNTYDEAAGAAIAQQNLDQIGRKVLSRVRTKLRNDTTFFTEFCDLLDEADLTELSKKLKGT